ncbi:hypothetical protein [Burkholderia sp. BCC1988]|uniref:hypothetical protein n=1 Tax=Burkholderia sp. BCC1988 TaxID=2817443 RepID=UPI002AB10DFF|nr:hypothetical protein [Burkholderia sp. BCC1988]
MFVTFHASLTRFQNVRHQMMHQWVVSTMDWHRSSAYYFRVMESGEDAELIEWKLGLIESHVAHSVGLKRRIEC